MGKIQVYDPPMCCATGVCGTDINPDLLSFAALLAKLAEQGVEVERFNLSQQAMAFAENPVLKEMLEEEGTEVLPAIFVNGQIYLKGRYPTAIERSAFSRAALSRSGE